MTRLSAKALLAAWIALAMPGAAFSASWGLRNQGAEAFVESDAGKNELVMACTSGKPMTLRLLLASTAGWRSDKYLSIDIDPSEFPMTIAGKGKSVMLNDLAGGVTGIAPALITAIIDGKVLALSGSAVDQMAQPALRFSLKGAAKAIAALQKACDLATEASPAVVSAVKTLPLKDGIYSTDHCDDSPLAGITLISLYTQKSGPEAGRQVLSPESEGQQGECLLTSFKSSGNIYSGSVRCEAGEVPIYSGTYKFRYEIQNDTTFYSGGVIYRLCAALR
jgi:hypothetical protein